MSVEAYRVTVDYDEDPVRTYRVWARSREEALHEVRNRAQMCLNYTATKIAEPSEDDSLGYDDEWRFDGQAL